MYVDSHCHLEMESFDSDRDQVIEACLAAGVRYMLTVGTEEVYFEKVLEIIDKNPAVYGAIGVHPHNSSDYSDLTAQKIRHFSEHPKIVGYGEIGLDFFKEHSPRQKQLAAFREQLHAAREIGLPVIIHSRSAEKETLEVLNNAYDKGCGGVMHCFSYNLSCAKKLLDIGLYISIPGTITYKNSEDLAEVVRYVPQDRLLAETDAPFLTPVPLRGKRNIPAYVELTIAKMASIKSMDIQELASSLKDNFATLFLNKNVQENPTLRSARERQQ